jgi:RPA family protein
VTGREPAWRVLAEELRASTEEEKGTGERAASYVLSPLGARMNRVLVVGTLAPPESVGRDPNAPFWRARLADPTGSVTVTAGGFQPRAQGALARIGQPTPALVVGKAHLFRGRDGNAYPSVRAEAIRALAPDEYRRGLAEAIEQTARRLELRERLARSPPPGEAELLDAGYPEAWVRGARESLKRYPHPVPGSYRASLAAALETVDGAGGAPPALAPAGPGSLTARVTRLPPPRPAAVPSVQDRAQEAIFLDIVDELCESAGDGYAELKEASALAQGRGLSAERVEELLNRLEEEGTLEEPIVGKLRRA